MGIFKKTSSEKKETENSQDISFLKQNIKETAATTDPSEKPASLPNLSDILKSPRESRSFIDKKGPDFRTIEDHLKQKPQEPGTTAEKPDMASKAAKPVFDKMVKPDRPAATAMAAPKPDDPAPKPDAGPKIAAPGEGAKTASPPLSAPTQQRQQGPTTIPRPGTPPAAARTAEPAPGQPVKVVDFARELETRFQKEIEAHKKQIAEQNKTINNLESTIQNLGTTINNLESSINKMESQGNNPEYEKITELAKINEMLVGQLTERIDSLEKEKESEGIAAISDEEKALIKAGKYLNKQITEVNKTFEELDSKITEMRSFMADVDETQRKFTEIQDQLNKMQRKTESIIEVDLMGKSNDAVKSLEDKKGAIVEEAESALKSVEDRVMEFKKDIEAIKQKSLDSIETTLESLKETERDIRKTVDEKIQYDSEHIKHINEVVTIMNEAVHKIIGREIESP